MMKLQILMNAMNEITYKNKFYYSNIIILFNQEN